MDYPVEFAATTVDAFADTKYFDKLYDVVTGHKAPKSKNNAAISDSARPRGDPSDHQPPASRRGAPSSRTHFDLSPSRHDLDEESEQSERVLREYEAERDDPSRKPSASLVGTSSRLQRRNKDDRRDSTRMSHANGGYGRSERPASRGGSKYDDYYDDEYDSDYDDRTGRRFKASGRGYDADRDRDFDREIIETERYRGVRFPIPSNPPPTY